jgi:hypothetical protein
VRAAGEVLIYSVHLPAVTLAILAAFSAGVAVAATIRHGRRWWR